MSYYPIDAMNIDQRVYRSILQGVCGGSLLPVKKTVELAAGHCHVELTTLVVGRVNDGVKRWKACLNG